MSPDFQIESRFLGITSSPAFVREPEGNGCAEWFIQVLKENLLWVRRFATVEDVKRQGKLDWGRHEEVDPRVGAGLPRWVHRSLPRRPLASELRALAPGAGPSHGLPGQA